MTTYRSLFKSFPIAEWLTVENRNPTAWDALDWIASDSESTQTPLANLKNLSCLFAPLASFSPYFEDVRLEETVTTLPKVDWDFFPIYARIVTIRQYGNKPLVRVVQPEPERRASCHVDDLWHWQCQWQVHWHMISRSVYWLYRSVQVGLIYICEIVVQ